MHNELGVGVRKSKADCFVAPPQHPMPKAIPIKGGGGVEIGGPKQKVIEFPEQRVAGAHGELPPPLSGSTQGPTT